MRESKIHATERLRREGRWDEASAFRDEARSRLRTEGKPKAEANEAAWEAMIEHFPPLPPPETTAVETDELDEAELDALSAQFDGKPADFARDAQWTYENLDNKRATPATAPCLGAWSMLKWARESPSRFFEHLLPKAIAAQQKQLAVDDWHAEEELNIAELERMLADLCASCVAPCEQQPANSTMVGCD